MRRNLILFCAYLIAVTLTSCNFASKPNPEQRTYETGYSSSSTATGTVEENPYINNSLSTGIKPYPSGTYSVDYEHSAISINTSADSNCDVIVIIKHKGHVFDNIYIKAGDSYTFEVPNGLYQVFFYGGKGWNPNKSMPNKRKGGFVANESYSKDDEISLYNQVVSYDLIPQVNGNFSTQQSNASEIF